MSRENINLPRFKLDPTQKTISTYFKVVPKNENLLNKGINFEKPVEDAGTKTTKNSNKRVHPENDLDQQLVILSSNKRLKWSDEIKNLAIIQHSNMRGSLTDTIKELRRLYPGSIFESLSKSLLHRWVSSTEDEQTEVPSKNITTKLGRKAYFPDHLLDEFKNVVHQFIQSKARLTTKMLLFQLKTIVLNKGYGDYLKENGGPFNMNLQWLRWFLHTKMGLSRRQPTTAAQKLPVDFELQIERMVLRLASLVSLHDIPRALVVNSDQTGVNFVPNGKKTWTQKGAQEVPVIGECDGRQVTAMVSSSASGDMLPLQVIFSGSEKSSRALPNTDLIPRLVKNKWHLTQTPTHWSTLKTMKDFVKFVLVPYFEQKIKDLNLEDDDHPKAVWLIDCWAVHKSKDFRDFLKAEYPWILVLYIPASCTSKAQPQDVSIQQPLKAHFMECFDSWALENIKSQVGAGIEPQKCTLDLKMKTLKPLVANWLFDAHQFCAEDRKNVLLGWEKPGLSKAWESDVQNSALKALHRGELFNEKNIDLIGDDSDNNLAEECEEESIEMSGLEEEELEIDEWVIEYLEGDEEEIFDC